MSLQLRRRRIQRVAVLMVGAPAVVVSLALVSFAMSGGESPVGAPRHLTTAPAPSVERDGFTLRGSAAVAMRPGTTSPVDVVIDNRRNHPLFVWDLAVAVAVVRAPRATPELPCDTTDFRAAAMTVPVVVEPHTTASLSDLDVDQDAWPHLTMVDSARNQDGCIDADLVLRFSARGMRAQ